MIVSVAGVWATLQVSLLWLATRGNPRNHAMASMAAVLFLLWCALGGGLMWNLRDNTNRLSKCRHAVGENADATYCTRVASASC